MANQKNFFEISHRDKKLLLILFSVLILALSYMLGYNKLSEEAQKYDREVIARKAVETELVGKEDNIDVYVANTEENINEYNGIIGRYGNGIYQTSTFEFLNVMERITGAWVKSVSFTGTTPIYTFGQIESSNPTSTSGIGYPTGLMGYKTSITLAYEAEYSQWKDFIKAVNNYYSKNTIENITMSYSDITGEVSGTITLGMYSVIDKNLVYPQPEFDVETGSENIFASDSVASTNTGNTTGEYIISNYDYYILLNSSASSVDACIIGKKDDAEQKTVISDNSNEVQNIVMTITGSDGKYGVKYSMGSKEYASEDLELGNTLDLLIMSSHRLSDEDKAGINLTINNQSDKEFNVKIYNDDEEESRITFKDNTGSIVIY